MTISDWEEYYQNNEIETMPWYRPGLDVDFENRLRELNLNSGTVLDIGSGPGTQAMALAERGFTVTATDIAATAVKKAQTKAKEKELTVEFIEDNIVKTKLGKQFNLILDRGCFHVIEPEERPLYANNVFNLLKPGGYLFLKCFSSNETRDKGPYRFTPKEIAGCFSDKFQILSITESMFRGTPPHTPIALVNIMQKR